MLLSVKADKMYTIPNINIIDNHPVPTILYFQTVDWGVHFSFIESAQGTSKSSEQRLSIPCLQEKELPIG